MGIPIYDIGAVYNDDGKIERVLTSHKDKDGELKDIDFKKESGGTRKVFSFIYDVMEALDKGKLLVADELDAKLHPLLLQNVISWFTEKKYNKNGAQLLFTSHDITTMCKEVFRRDEIWFAALNADDESFLYSLADFKKEGGKKPRKDETYSKQYLEGRYGADPYLQKFNSWEA
jgi:AAA15 family ATPase/GTPase